ncbi:alpha-ketoacid dehydrogenase subunit alpha/beta [Fulvivirga sedimenti]|uniref:3-methyl-2-oxobutanoate dehydrogenase (2-methylpropanoyl-transferring) n=1 Tax=Fulvivirga sedimenti TaxID=2879465 RepID=A0A9X1HS12_9BACT|nr:alpha-ketoacid dehydrogenase subunit alpha/beta [Fulvivirga sedimenti]MCA6074954.1 tungsten formylmethanofuran dehydrogenase [Fulvivirga sedimenti]MCA6076131.1 tungsten formylmethanofuran dehydrogenase [Fulvivirga sedimenti]MCA6077259.1 tungsten formylmethanofuran dehydrogenase [Fulvivirga sedimenti]
MSTTKAAVPGKASTTKKNSFPADIPEDILLKAYQLMCTARRMSDLYDEHRDICSKYVHSTSRGHEAIQLAIGLQLTGRDYASLYYRDESILLGIGMQPYELMLQLLARKDDPFSGGRTYYAHPSLDRDGFPKIPHQSSATGMQGIPATGMAQGLQYLEDMELIEKEKGLVFCSFGDGSITEGEVSEAFQMAVLKNMPILYVVQDNDWGISATGKEMRAMNAYEFAAGFKGMKRYQVDGADFMASYRTIKEAMNYVRDRKGPAIVHATCPLLGHHTSGVRKEWYRGDDDLKAHEAQDPIPVYEKALRQMGVSTARLKKLREAAEKVVESDYQYAVDAPEPDPSEFDTHIFAPTPIVEEKGNRHPEGGEKVVMVDAALHAVDEILKKHPEALLYGQDVGGTLGGVFREAATLAQKYGDTRVFNTPIQEAYIVGSTAGMSAVGTKPIVEIQFADYIWPGINQLVEELSKSCYLSMGKFPVQSLIRVPTGAYGGGGPYHSGSVESALLAIRGIKVVYPSNAADMKGLFKAAFYDPNPVVMLEHKGLYWSKVPGTAEAKTIEPDSDYVIPLGKGRMHLEAAEGSQSRVLVVTYGMGVYWATAAAKNFEGRISVLDLRTLHPVDWDLIAEKVSTHNRVLVLTEEQKMNSFAESLAGQIGQECFEHLDAPVRVMGSASLPAVPLNVHLESQMLPNAEKVASELEWLLSY